jgi:signal transduction histidine kinase
VAPASDDNGRVGLVRAWAPAVVLGAGGAVESLVRSGHGGLNPQYRLLLCLVALCGTMPVAAPVVLAVLVVTPVSVLAMTVFHDLTVAGLVAQLLVLYQVRRPFAVALSLAFPVIVLSGVLDVRALLLASLAPAAAVAGIARQARTEATTHRAARQVIAGTLLEHTARGERARIARELHDVVAHHISVIAVQAETARLTVPGMPAAGAARLSEISATARAGLTEMRRLLGVLREDTDVAERRPQPGLRQLNELLDEARDASSTGTRLIVSGKPVTLDPGVELAAYRIIQEALTNARRHAAGAAVDVELRYGDDGLRVRVSDNGPGGSPAPAGGHGLLGMRERAAAVGGQLRAGPAAIGGFLVEARLPAKEVTA